MNSAILEEDVIKLRETLNNDVMKSIDSKLDTIHSIWKRLKVVDENGNGNCEVTGEPFTFWTLVCGHMIKRRHTKYRWDDYNTAAIDPEVNSKEESDSLYEPMRDYKVSTIGLDLVEEMERSVHLPFKMTHTEKDTLLRTRRLQCRELLKDKNFNVQIP